MLSTHPKVTLLLKAGLTVPRFPERKLPIQERYLRPGARMPNEALAADLVQRLAVAEWTEVVHELFRATWLVVQKLKSERLWKRVQKFTFPS